MIRQIKEFSMKKLILGILLTAVILHANNIKVEVTNIINQTGQISIGLYNKDDSTFSDMSQYYKGKYLDISGTKITYTFQNIPNGIYAISVIHDENNNRELDKNFFGIPTEGYGFSNNVRPTFRSANFQESKFELSSDKTIVIHLGY